MGRFRQYFAIVSCAAVTAGGLVAGTATAAAAPISVSVGDVSMAEGNSGFAAARVPLELSGPTSTNVVVNYKMVSSAGTLNKTIGFLAGQTAKSVTVRIPGDLNPESNEVRSITVTSAAGAEIAKDTGTLTVVDDDPAAPSGTVTSAATAPLTVSIGTATVVEGNAGSHYAYLPVTLSDPAPTQIVVDVLTKCGSATTGTDYQAPATRTLNFAIGTRTKTLKFLINSDTSPETVDDFFQALRVRLGSAIVGVDGSITILDTDPGAPPQTGGVGTDGNIERVSVASDGSQADSSLTTSTCQAGRAGSFARFISDDDRLVVFVSKASNLVPNGPIDAQFHWYVRDRSAGTTSTISAFTGGAIADGDGVMGLSGSGRFLVFFSQRAALLPSGVTGAQGFRYDRLSGATEMVTRLPNGSTRASGAYPGSISADGSRISFTVQESTPGAATSYVRDLTTQTTLDIDGAEKYAITLSRDGSTVAYISTRIDLVAADTNAASDVFKQTLATGVIAQVNLTPSGAQDVSFPTMPASNPSEPRISNDGRYVLFRSLSPTLAVHSSDYFIRDTLLNTTTRVDLNITVPPSQGTICFVNDGQLDGSGRRVAVNFKCEQADGAERPSDLSGGFVVDLDTHITTRFDVDANGGPADGSHSLWNAVLGNGGHGVAFTSGATNLIANDTNDVTDAFFTSVP